MSTPFERIALLGEALERTASRLEKARLIGEVLRSLAPDEVAPAVRLTIGRVFAPSDPRALNVSAAAVWRAVEPVAQALAPETVARIRAEARDLGDAVRGIWEAAGRGRGEAPPLALREVYTAFEEIAADSGPGSRARRDERIAALLARADPVEAEYLAKNLVREMRHGVSEGVMVDAVAAAAGVKPAEVRRALQLSGDLGAVAAAALAGGSGALAGATVQLFAPLLPMLADTADSVADALARHGPGTTLEHKLDGARVQIHRRGDEVRIYSRTLSDVTASLPEVCREVRAKAAATEAIFDGEAVAVGPDGRPLPFQEAMRRYGREREVERAMAAVPMRLILFDILYLDGRALIDLPYRERAALLEQAAGGLERVPRRAVSGAEEGEAFLAEALAAGHEGLVAKDPRSAYTPGRRGKGWLKIKRAVTLDLVIIAAEWGYGRRHGWLSNYHLGARDEEHGGFAMVGKTFKGLTDAEFARLTEELLALKTGEERGAVTVEPKIVVEVAFNNVQRSPRYPSGVALRFARIVGFRPDKTPADADTIETVRRLL